MSEKMKKLYKNMQNRHQHQKLIIGLLTRRRWRGAETITFPTSKRKKERKVCVVNKEKTQKKSNKKILKKREKK
jgi:K+-sensing histidine kinase KdpD